MQNDDGLVEREAKEALRRWHRDTCYPDASPGELEIGLNAILAPFRAERDAALRDREDG